MKNLDKFKSGLKNVDWIGVLMAVGTGVFAVVNSLGEQKKDKEFEELKKAVANLEKK